MGHRRYDHLGNPVAPVDNKVFGTMVDHNDLDFATVVGINSAGRVHKAYAVLYGKPGPRADLCLISYR